MVLLTPDELLMLGLYRASNVQNREHIRFFASAAASEHEEKTAEIIPFFGRKK